MGAEQAMVYALGFSPWKRPYVRLCFPAGVVFVDALDDVPRGQTLVVWGRCAIPGQGNYQLIRLEDGFLRSVGLGADLVRPMSWVVDPQGIYFDATAPSRLENLLQAHVFDEALLARARQLRDAIVQAGISKYNVGSAGWCRPQTSQRIVLVTGQVETDASLAFGAFGLRRNFDLLQAVRRRYPDDYLVYKPHPDVVAGMRRSGEGEEQAGDYCDEVVTDVPIGDVMATVDEVHVMTSLAGFEALLRGKRVVCHGMPFYAGWGLTEDALSCERRTRRLSLDQLVAGALLCYPVYFDRDGTRLITPEEALTSLSDWRAETQGREPWWRGLARMALRRIVGVR